MSEKVVYKALDIPKLELYVEHRKETVKNFHDLCDQYKEKLGVKSLHGISMYAGGWIVQGYVKEKYSEEVPIGWRLARKGAWEVVPAKRTPEGKLHEEELKKLSLANAKYPGFPEMLFGEHHSVYPRLRKYNEEDYYIVLSRPVDDSGVDRALWEKVSLAEFYAKTENKEFEDFK